MPKVAPPSRLRSVANVVVAQLDTALVTAGSFVVTPAVLFGLGDSAYGGWLLINSFINYMRLLDLGTSAGTVKFGAGAEARGDADDLGAVLNTSTAIYALLAATALLVTLGFTHVLPALYPSIASEQGGTILVLGAAMVVELALRPFVAALRMRSMHWVHDAVEIATYSTFKLGLVLHFAYARRLDYQVLAWLTFGETAVRSLVCLVAALWIAPASRKVNPFHASRATARKLVTMGAAMSIIMIADVVRFQLDAGVLGWFLPNEPQNISIFGVGTRLASVSYMAIGMIASVLMPRFSGILESGDKKSGASLLRTSSLVTGLAASFVLVNIAVLGPPFLHLWLHKPWIDISGRILLIVLPGYYVALLSGPSSSLLIGAGKLRGLTLLSVVEAFVNFVISIALVRPLGVYGVAIGTAVPLVLFRGVVFPLLLQKELDTPVAAYARLHVRAVSIGVVYLVLVGGLAFLHLASYPMFAVAGVASTMLYVVLVVIAIPEVRAVFLRRLRSAPSV